MIAVAGIGTEEIQPPGKVVPELLRPGMRIGPPPDFSRYDGTEHDRFITRALTGEVMYEIMRLSGQEYVDIYVGAAGRRIDEAVKAPGREGRKQNRKQNRKRDRFRCRRPEFGLRTRRRTDARGRRAVPCRAPGGGT